MSPRRLGVRLDAAGLVSQALRDSRSANPFGRALRDLTGHDAGIRIGMRATYSHSSLDAVVRHVQRAVGHRARAADVDFTERGLRLLLARDGVAVPAVPLERAIVDALVARDADRRIQVPVRITRRPRRTIADLRDHYAVLIGISRPRKQLRLYRHLHLVKTYKIAVGQLGFKTKAGRYQIVAKATDPPWQAPDEPWAGRFAGKLVPANSPDNPIKARWLRYYDGQGIHGTDDRASLGAAASHGCIRMSIPDVKELYRRVPLHTPVIIV